MISNYKSKQLVSRMAKVMGSLGGKARKKSLSKERAHEIAVNAGRAGGLKKAENRKERQNLAKNATPRS